MAQPMPQPKRRGRTLQEAWEEAEAGLAHANLMVDQLRALVGGPRKEELRMAGKDYCRNCGVEIFVPRMNEQRTGPLMHVALVPYRQCKMLTNAQWEDGHEEPPKPPTDLQEEVNRRQLAIDFLRLSKSKRQEIAKQLDAFDGYEPYDDIVVLGRIREDGRIKELAAAVDG